MLRIVLGGAVLALTAFTAEAGAQALGGGDFQRCAVYRPDGSFAGYSNACLERQRASIRRSTGQSQGYGNGYGAPRNNGYYNAAPVYNGQAAYPCPSWANNGRGYSSTTRPWGIGIEYGTFNSTVNGQACIPGGSNQFLRGVN